MPNAEALLTATDAARVLHVHPQTVRTLARRGRLPHRRLGRAYLFTRADLDAYVQPQIEVPLEAGPAGDPPAAPPTAGACGRHIREYLSRLLCVVGIRPRREEAA